MKIKDEMIHQDAVIHCKTSHELDKLFDYLDTQGYVWFENHKKIFDDYKKVEYLYDLLDTHISIEQNKTIRWLPKTLLRSEYSYVIPVDFSDIVEKS